MSIKNVLGARTTAGRAGDSKRAGRRTSRIRTKSLRVECLESRQLLAAMLFVDFGDNFPGGTLSTTQGGFRDVANALLPGNRVLGTTLDDGAGNFNAGTSLDIVAQSFSVTDRAQMMAVVRRAYLPMDVTVVELTANVQTTIDGRNVRGAASMADVVNTLRAGDAGSKDEYVFVATFNVGGANPTSYGSNGGGNSPGGPHGTTLDTTDLSSAANRHDDVVAVYSDGGFSLNTANNIAHEAGHGFGLQHAITKATNNAPIDLFHQAEIMSYRNTNNTTSSIAFTRYPMIRGDDNSPGGPVVNYNDLAARDGQVTLYDQLRLDGNVGANPAYSFVSGTGAFDVITIARNGGNADVSVQAFADAAYTQPITVPSLGGTTYRYSFPLNNAILVDAGDSDDRIIVDGDLGVDVRIDGMLGTDTLQINGKDAASAVYTANPTAPIGVDRVADFGGTVSIGATSIVFDDFETAGSVSIQNVGSVIYQVPPAGDGQLTVRRAGGDVELLGTVNDGIGAVPLVLVSVSRLDVAGGTANDTLKVDSSNGLVNLPKGIHYDGGGGFDTLQLVQTGGDVQTADLYTVGPNAGEGTSFIAGPGGVQKVYFQNLSPVLDLVPATTLTVVGTPADNAINYTSGSAPANGLVTVDNFESIEFSNKDNLRLDGGQGDNQINVKNANIPDGAPPGGLKSIIVVHGAPSVMDVVPLAFAATEGFPLSEQPVAAFRDPNFSPLVPGAYTATIDWGDGVTTAASSIVANGDALIVRGNHTYSEETETGPNAVKVTVSRTPMPLDPNPVSVQTTSWVSVADPSVLAAPVAIAAVEGKAFVDVPVATFTDPGTPAGEPVDDYSAQIDWGDGSAQSPAKIVFAAGTFSVLGSHTYGEEGSFTATVSIHHETSNSVVLTAAVTVADPAVIAAPVNFDAVEGKAFVDQAVATFTDPGGAEPNPADPDPVLAHHYTATIDWGDGTPAVAGTISFAGGVFTVSGGHTYIEESHTGSFAVTVSIVHELLPPVVVVGAAAVADPAVLAVGGLAINGDAGVPTGVVTLATFTDPAGPEPNPSDPDPVLADHYTATVNWGDGSTTAETITGPVAGQYTVAGDHTYALGGVYTILVTVNHELAPPSVATSKAIVTGAGVVNGVLWVVGSDGNDKIEVEPWSKATGHMAGKKGQIHVEGIPFLPGKYHEMNFNPAGVTRVEVLARGGDDFVQVEGNLRIPAIIDGGAGNDKLIVGIAGGVVLGGEGNDTLISDYLQGTQGFSILIGGAGADKLYNKSKRGSILIGGTTDYDYDAFGLPNDAALNSLLKEWASGASYGARVHNLQAGDGLNSPLKLDASTVHRDAAVKDQFFQQSTGLTWYFAHITGGTTPYDSISGKKNSESVFALLF